MFPRDNEVLYDSLALSSHYRSLRGSLHPLKPPPALGNALLSLQSPCWARDFLCIISRRKKNRQGDTRGRASKRARPREGGGSVVPKVRAMDYPLAFKALNTMVMGTRRKLDLPNEYQPIFFCNLSYYEYHKVSESLFSLPILNVSDPVAACRSSRTSRSITVRKGSKCISLAGQTYPMWICLESWKTVSSWFSLR